MRLIDAEVLANWIDGSQRLDTEHDYEEVARYIEECPTVDAVPVVRLENIAEADGGPLAFLDEILEKMNNIVEVVRCKDCDMWNEEDFSGRKSLGNYRCSCAEWSNMEDGRRVYTGPDEFCSRGERKGGDE